MMASFCSWWLANTGFGSRRKYAKAPSLKYVPSSCLSLPRQKKLLMDVKSIVPKRLSSFSDGTRILSFEGSLTSLLVLNKPRASYHTEESDEATRCIHTAGSMVKSSDG